MSVILYVASGTFGDDTPDLVTRFTTRSISVRIGQFLSERSRTQLVHVISTLVLSERRQILSHIIFNEGYQCHNDSVPIILTLF